MNGGGRALERKGVRGVSEKERREMRERETRDARCEMRDTQETQMIGAIYMFKVMGARVGGRENEGERREKLRWRYTARGSVLWWMCFLELRR